ncbi:MAG TPA: hypothetical protein VD966_06050 [Pyrinomonadaceae bacterium]|nr:hypothetical protein [Pyrinomonadaceae bacterium]
MDFDEATSESERIEPNATEQSRLFDLLGRINYFILRGARVYLEVHGTAYRVLYGLYWQSVFSGEQHWGLKCEEIGHVWIEKEGAELSVVLPLRYTQRGWVIEAHSLQCPLYAYLLAVHESEDFFRSDEE